MQKFLAKGLVFVLGFGLFVGNINIYAQSAETNISPSDTISTYSDASLEKEYPNAECSLNFSNPLELMIAVILSAQSTDAMINKITPKLFNSRRKVLWW